MQRANEQARDKIMREISLEREMQLRGSATAITYPHVSQPRALSNEQYCRIDDQSGAAEAPYHPKVLPDGQEYVSLRQSGNNSKINSRAHSSAMKTIESVAVPKLNVSHVSPLR